MSLGAETEKSVTSIPRQCQRDLPTIPRLRSLGAISVFALLMLLGATAQSKVVTYGTGLKSCEVYLVAKEQQSADEVAFIDWLSGYMSAANSISNSVNNILGDTNLLRATFWLDRFCHAHPQAQVAVALDLLVVGARSTVARRTVDVTTYGVGFKSCSSYITARQQQGADESSFVDWLGGYLSAVNAFSLSTDNVLGNLDLTAAILWVDDYCQAHLGERFSSAAEARALAKNR